MPRAWTKYFTGDRLETYMMIKELFRRGSQDYKDAIKELEKRQRLSDAARIREEKKREERLKKKEAEKAKKRAEKAAERLAFKQAKKINANELIMKIKADVVGEATVREIWNTVNSSFRLIVNDYDRIVDGSFERNDKGYKHFRKFFTISGDSEPDWIFDEGDSILVVKPSNIQPKLLVQRFRKGVNHCVFKPIIRNLSNRIEDASESTAKRLKQRINSLKQMETEYLQKTGDYQGVLETDMENVGKTAGLKIVLQDIFKDEIASWNGNGRVGTIALRNTRENHVDESLVVSSDPIPVSESEMKQIYNDVRKSGDFFDIHGDVLNGIPSKLETLEGCFSVVDADKEACIQFDKEMNIIQYKINANKHPILNDFLKAGRIVNGWNCDINGGIADGCLDMPKAYAQFKKCHLYAGFLGHIHQFRSGSFDRKFIEEHIGFYGAVVLGGGDWLAQKLGMTEGKYVVLFSQEMLYFMNNGVKFLVDQGAWGSKFDFEFPEYMMKKVRYSKWAGKLGMEKRETTHTIPGSKQWAEHLAVHHKVKYWGSDLITVYKPTKKVLTAHHILGGITAYVRIQMMEAMKKFHPDQLVRVVSDGIYYKGERPAGLEWFGTKEIKTSDYSSPWYNTVDICEIAPSLGRILGNALLTGQGGSGKTYSIFTDHGFIDVLYVSPSHLLGQDVNAKYGAKYTTIHKLLGIDARPGKACRTYRDEFAVPSILFIDEITQIPAAWIDKAIKMYPEALILLAGDIDSDGRWFQCRSGDGDKWNEIWSPKHKNIQVIEFLEDRRSRDEELKQLKLKIREAMRVCSNDCALMEMTQWAYTNLPLTKEIDFKGGDTCIAGTHKTNQKLLDKGIVSGWYKKGGFVSIEEKDGYEKRGSFTIHAYQGKTIESGNVWIVLNDMFEYAMLYTAVSRVVNSSQLKFIWKV